MTQNNSIGSGRLLRMVGTAAVYLLRRRDRYGSRFVRFSVVTDSLRRRPPIYPKLYSFLHQVRGWVLIERGTLSWARLIFEEKLSVPRAIRRLSAIIIEACQSILSCCFSVLPSGSRVRDSFDSSSLGRLRRLLATVSVPIIVLIGLSPFSDFPEAIRPSSLRHLSLRLTLAR